MFRVVTLGWLVWLCGCAELLGLDDYRKGETSGGGASGSGGQGGGATAEVCLDHVDNDRDGAVDCEDDDCSNHECLPGAPLPWIGPVTLAIGAPATLPACPGAPAAFEGGTGGAMIPPPECPCTCDTTPVLDCQGNFSFSDMAGCNVTSQFSGSGCFDVTTFGGFVTADTGSSGLPTCGVTSTDPPIAPVTWPNMVRGCASEVGGGCGEHVCVASPAGFDRSCIYQPGNVTCPPGDYREQLIVERYNPANDTRMCSADCTCSTWNAGCSGTLTVFDDASCGGTSYPVPSSPCTDAGFTIGSAEYAAVVTGTCNPATRAARGTVTAFDTTTVCCKPL